MPQTDTIELIDHHPETAQFRNEAMAGLRATPKTLPCKYFYDRLGSQLFDQICELDAYYPTRTESAIMDRFAGEMAEAIGAGAMLVEYGSGSSVKTRILLGALEDLVAYVPLDISRDHLLFTVRQLLKAYPSLDVLPVCADYTQPFELPEPPSPAAQLAAYFPGSTIGNFTPPEAHRFLANVARVVGTGGGLLIGVDLKKDPAVLELAYDDPEGVTAEFNLNLLRRMNHELGATFPLGRFKHRAIWNEDASRVEMHLVSLDQRRVTVDGNPVEFDAGETIHTENSHKYTLDHFADLAGDAGFDVAHVWTDDRDYFSVQYLVAR